MIGRRPGRSPLIAGATCALVVLTAGPAGAQEPAVAPAPAPTPEQAAAAASPRLAGSEVPVPRRTHFVMPAYPAEAVAAGLRGIVILEIVIDPEGRVAFAEVVRSVPPFDDAALAAVRQWTYEPTRAEGKPVSVRLTVPITFAIKLPETIRAQGVPELRTGAVPVVPAGLAKAETAGALLLIAADGALQEAQITEGGPGPSEALLQALRTWRFAARDGEPALLVRLAAEFVPSGKPGDAGRVTLRLSDPRPVPAATLEAASAAASAPTPEAAPETTAAPAPPQATAPAPAPAPQATPAMPAVPAAPTPVAAPSAAPTPAAPPVAQPSPAAAPVASATPGARPIPPAATTPARPVPVARGPQEEVVPAVARPTPAATPATAPAAAVVPESGVSAVRDVTLGPNIPDLTEGRRPVVPPLARMAGVAGSAVVTFSVDGAGDVLVHEAGGAPELIAAARSAVQTWKFRRLNTERIGLRAHFTFAADQATARVERLP